MNSNPKRVQRRRTPVRALICKQVKTPARERERLCGFSGRMRWIFPTAKAAADVNSGNDLPRHFDRSAGLAVLKAKVAIRDLSPNANDPKFK